MSRGGLRVSKERGRGYSEGGYKKRYTFPHYAWFVLGSSFLSSLSFVRINQSFDLAQNTTVICWLVIPLASCICWISHRKASRAGGHLFYQLNPGHNVRMSVSFIVEEVHLNWLNRSRFLILSRCMVFRLSFR